MSRFLKRNWQYILVVFVLLGILGFSIYNTKVADISSVQQQAAQQSGLNQTVYDPTTDQYRPLTEFFEDYGNNFVISEDGLPLDPETLLPINPSSREPLTVNEVSSLPDSSNRPLDQNNPGLIADNSDSKPTPGPVVTITPGISETDPKPGYQNDVVIGDRIPLSLAATNRRISDGTDTGQDEFNTDPTEEGKPKPVNISEQVVDYSNSFTIYLTIDCRTLVDNPNLEEGLERYVGNGYILEKTPVLCYAGENIFSVLVRECKARGINLESLGADDNKYGSAYIQAINNLGEFDAGELSGWLYKVDGWFPNYGCQRYVPISGESVEFVYTCDLGRDVGNIWIGGN